MFHSLDGDGGNYWDESAYYEFTAAEVDRLEAATEKLQEMCLAAGQFIIDNNRWSDLKIPVEAIAQIKKTWNDEPPALYGRFDLAYDGKQIKLLEYNADTPTALLEAAVVQWYWLQDLFPEGRPVELDPREADCQVERPEGLRERTGLLWLRGDRGR